MQEHLANSKALCCRNSFIKFILIVLEIDIGMENFQQMSRDLTCRMCTCIAQKNVVRETWFCVIFNVVIFDDCSPSMPSDQCSGMQCSMLLHHHAYIPECICLCVCAWQDFRFVLFCCLLCVCIVAVFCFVLFRFWFVYSTRSCCSFIIVSQ